MATICESIAISGLARSIVASKVFTSPEALNCLVMPSGNPAKIDEVGGDPVLPSPYSELHGQSVS